MKSLFKTVFIIIIFSVITRLIGFFFRIYISRTIGAEALGQYQVSFSIFMVLLTAISSGLPFIISRLTAKYQAIITKDGERKMVTAGMIIGICSSIILCGLVIVFLPVLKLVFTDDKCITILLILLPALVFSSVYSTLRGNIWGRNKYFSMCATELFEQIVRVFIFMILISGMLGTTDGAYVSAISMTISCVLSGILVLIVYLIGGGKFKFSKDKKIYKDILKQSTPITGVRIAASLVQPIIALVVPLRLVAFGYTSAQALSLYGIAIGMTLPFLFIPSTVIGSLSTALVPDLSSALAKQDFDHIKKRITTALKFTIIISALFIPLYMGAGEFIGKFFYDNSQSGIMLTKSAWLVLPLGLTNISASLLNSLGYEIKSMRNYVLGAILMFLSIWFLPKYLGIYSLIWGFGICFVLTCLLNLKMIAKVTDGKLSIFKHLVLSIAFIIPSAAICSFICNLLNNIIPLFFSLAISCSIATIFFVLLCVIFNLINYESVIIHLKSKIKFKTLKNKRKINNN